MASDWVGVSVGSGVTRAGRRVGLFVDGRRVGLEVRRVGLGVELFRGVGRGVSSEDGAGVGGGGDWGIVGSSDSIGIGVGSVRGICFRNE